ncbi:imelysin family protein [Thiomicrorhabdus sediminis]|uniref:Peptidase, imelysin family protein n=1 Tax=Thiomicrorhabdus sediminis TaxID=2580412 RepID=A0A4P9K334_9GAMM|nr:imelysin family protein [Thiomicrorhabdus sediminis]QCU89238.1 peptidase, imelysin family protein [Thiomicrorhabdus sediminis]
MELISRVAPFAASLLLASTAVMSTAVQAVEHDLNKMKKVLESNADMGLAVYSDTLNTAKQLRKAIAELRAQPNQANLMAARKAWLVAREPYGQSEAFRFRLSPIDSSNYKDEDGLEGDINAWPLGEALIDYVVVGNDFGNDQLGVSAHQTPVNGGKAITVDSLQANIINTPSIEITPALIANTATAEDEHDVLAGYHAIEFMLWGQDLNNSGSADTQGKRQQAVKTWQSINATGGQRPLTDFISKQENDAADRRLTFLEVVTDKLVADLQTVVDGWKQGVQGNYRDKFTTVNSIDEAKQKFAEILTGIGTLAEGELAGERMQIALSADSQEDEQSCFSDNTHRDIWLDVQGIVNIYYGDYRGYDANLDGKPDSGNSLKGYGIDDYLTDIGERQLGKDVEAKLALIQNGANKIDAMARQGTPVDVMIMDPGSDAAKPMRDTIVALNKQSASIAKLAKAIDIQH